MKHIHHRVTKRIIAVIVAVFGLAFLSGVQAKQHNWLRSTDPDVMTVITRDGERHEGLLLCATDSLFVIWLDLRSIDIDQMDKYLYVLSFAELESVGLESRGIFRKVRIVTIRGDYDIYRRLLPWFRDQSVYPLFRQVAIRERVNTIAAGKYQHSTTNDSAISATSMLAVGQAEESQPTGKKIRPRSNTSKFHVSTGIGPPESEPRHQIVRTFKSSGLSGYSPGYWGPGTNYPHGAAIGGNSYVEAGYSIAGWLRFGLGLQSTPRQYVKGFHGELETIREGVVYSLLASFVPEPIYSDLPLFAQQGHEMQAGIGICYQSAEISGNQRKYGPDHAIIWKKVAVGLHLKASVDLFLTRSLSIQIRFDEKRLPNMEIPAREYVHWESQPFQEPDMLVERIEPHTISLASSTFSIGLQVHL